MISEFLPCYKILLKAALFSHSKTKLDKRLSIGKEQSLISLIYSVERHLPLPLMGREKAIQTMK